MISEKIQRTKYVLGDFVSSNVAWLCFNSLRYSIDPIHSGFTSLGAFLGSPIVLTGQLVFPLLMMIVYYLSGYYNDVFHKSRVQEAFTTLWSTGSATLAIFLLVLINDTVPQRRVNYEMIALLWLTLFAMVYMVRCVFTSHTSHMIKSRQWSFNTLIIGRGGAGVAFGNKLNAMPRSLGYNIIGYVSIPGENDVKEMNLPCYSLSDIKRACHEHHIEELIVVPTRKDPDLVLHTINQLFELNLPIKVTPDRFNVLLSKTRISDMVGDPLIDISGSNMSEGSKNIKRVIDIVLSVIVLVVLSPLLLAVAVAIKLDSPGPVFYLQERIGFHNVPFNIIKFRSMRQDAEQENRPQLTTDDDPRVTRIGRLMRKYRIDELPQFWNVVRGEMSIVGPRPERQYYIDQITARVPSYALLHQVRPGITSMGMVKYGYAQNVDQMVERLSYDLLYLENMSLLNDFKIMVYTIKTIITGKGM
ncbi:MAG: sugar transferase [Muribaculaceae bacterium]|nr:sugar transferase [Muribaculaceae bacterium]